MYYKPLINSNIITCMMQIIRGMDKLKIEFDDERRLVSGCKNSHANTFHINSLAPREYVLTGLLLFLDGCQTHF